MNGAGSAAKMKGKGTLNRTQLMNTRVNSTLANGPRKIATPRERLRFLIASATLVILLVLCAGASAQVTTGTTGYGLVWSATSGQVSITGYSGSGGAVSIPGTINISGTSLPVTGISYGAFSGCGGLTSVIVPNSITAIGDYAFASCVNLTGVYFEGNAPTLLGSNVFSSDQNTTVYYATQMKGWGVSYGGRPTMKFWADAPLVTTSAVGNIQTDEVTLNGTTNPNGLTTTAYFEYGLTTSYGSIVSVKLSPINGSSFQNVSATIRGLLSGTTYHYRLTASNSLGSSSGADRTFVSVPFTYTITNNQVTITGYSGTGGAASIPGTISGLPVTSIGSEAFFNCKTLTSVTIPSGVTSIGSRAFAGCSGLTGVTIPSSVVSIGSEPFKWCHGLMSITVDTMNAFFCSVDGVLFNKDQTALIECPGGKTGSYAIPGDVKSIGDYAFYCCISLTSVTIPSGLTSIGNGAFGGTNLTSVTIPSSVVSIGTEAFKWGYSLKSITVDSMNSFFCSADGVLFNKDQTTLIECPTGKAGSYTIPNSVTSIGDFAFSSCLLTSVTIPNSVRSIGNGAFSFTNLTTVTIPSSVTSIGAHAFDCCNGLMNVIIPASITSIGEYAFSNCTKLTSVTIPASVTSIGAGAFWGCSSLTSIIIPNGVASIEDSAFAHCTGLATVTIPTGVTSIGSSAFYSCSGLTSIGIPDSVTSIGGYAFVGCTSLTNVAIPGRVTSIGRQAFSFCNKLRSAVFMGDAPSVEPYAFDSAASSFRVYYFNGSAGFTSPTWQGYPSVNMGASSPVPPWLLRSGLAHNANLQSAPNGDGVTLLMAYALNLDPTRNLSGSIPRPVVSGSNISLTYYAASNGVTYRAETSTDLKTWSTTEVTLSGPDANHCYTATVPISAGAPRFMRLVVSY